MKKQKNYGVKAFMVTFLVLYAAHTAVLYVYNKQWCLISVISLAFLLVAFLLCYKRLRRFILNRINFAAGAMTDTSGGLINSAEFPVIVLSDDNTVQWCNNAFLSFYEEKDNVIGRQLSTIVDNAQIEKLMHFKSAEFALQDKIFKAFVLLGSDEKIVYLVDQTKLKKMAAEYKFSRPVTAILQIDALDETFKDAKDSTKAQIGSHVQNLIENWFIGTGGIMYTLSRERFMLIFEQRYLKRFEEERFKILEQVREFRFEDNKFLTISIGVAHGCKSFRETEVLARQALDMALSRGGDQAAVKSPDSDYRFYGGVKSAIEKGSRVRSRVMAKAFGGLIEGSNHILLMGHKFSDLDSLGSAFAFAAALNSMGKQANIVLNKDNTMARTLLNYITEAGFGDLIVSGEEILPLIDEQTLLIVVDTHRPEMLDYPEVYRKAKKVAVIDHHRKSTDHISNALIFYNETAVSSVCEMVTELWQYMGAEFIGNIEADALLSGIMLDTKNFVFNTGVRTFEAAAYLRRRGANPITVKKMFSDSMQICKDKYEVISSAQIYNNCVIAVNTAETENARLVSAQAVDELLGVEGVKAAFVLFSGGEKIGISARSFGEVNVQLVMEALGGGGHKTMAACTLADTDINSALRQLMETIDKYFKDR